MNAIRPDRSTLRILVPVLALFLTTLAGHGCREELGPEHFASTSLSGLVVEEKEPVRGGWIEFIPIDGALGDIRSARIGADGSFRADKVPIGSCAIRIVNAPIQTRGAAELFSQPNSPIRRVIAADSREPLKLDLVEEMVQFSAQRARALQRSRAGAGGNGNGSRH
ncbi:MAG: hypothetical protein ACLP7Q_13030 [Isosphaeraceae bacterium]